MNTIKLIVLFAMVGASGCSTLVVSKAPKEENTSARALTPPADKALLYIYRTGSTLGGDIVGTLSVDGIKVGKTARSRYHYLLLEPGTHTITLESSYQYKPYELNISTDPGQTYFVLEHWKIPSGIELKQTDEIDGRKGIESSSLAKGLRKIEDTQPAPPAGRGEAPRP